MILGNRHDNIATIWCNLVFVVVLKIFIKLKIKKTEIKTLNHVLHLQKDWLLNANGQDAWIEFWPKLYFSMKQKIVHLSCHYLVLDAKCGSTRSIARACSPWRGRPSARNRTLHRNRWNRNLNFDEKVIIFTKKKIKFDI